VHSPVAGANPDLNFVLGSKRGIDQCLESALSNPVTLCLIGGSVLAAKFNNAAALASFVATGRVFALGAVMQDLQNDINSSPDPYQTGIGYGRRFCIWIGAAVAFALAGGGQGGSGSGGSEPAGSSPLGAVLRRFGSAPDGARRPAPLANANQWLPQFTQANCDGNCGYVVLGQCAWRSRHRSARRVHSRQFTRIYATSLGPVRART
jgi:hypothetical protein